MGATSLVVENVQVLEDLVLKVNIYNRDRKGGHQPSVFAGFEGIYSYNPAGRKFSKKVHVRCLRRESEKATEQALNRWYLEQEQESFLL